MTDTPRGPEALAELARCRDEIEQIDRQIIALLSRRLTLGRRTGELKRLAGLPILDPSREAAVIRRVTGEARDAGLPPEPVREMFWQIVGMSRRVQESGDAAGDDLMSGGDQL